MSSVAGGEFARQHRVLEQTLSMHTMLRDRYASRALALDMMLLGCSVTFCATTFIADDALARVGLSADRGRTLLGLASIGAFFCSLTALRVDWKGRSARHAEAVRKLSTVLGAFRKVRKEDSTRSEEGYGGLHDAYWATMNDIIAVPAAAFLGLKGRHRRKVQISKMLDTNPGCPVFVLRLLLFCRSIVKVKRGTSATEGESGNAATHTCESGSDEHH